MLHKQAEETKEIVLRGQDATNQMLTLLNAFLPSLTQEAKAMIPALDAHAPDGKRIDQTKAVDDLVTQLLLNLAFNNVTRLLQDKAHKLANTYADKSEDERMAAALAYTEESVEMMKNMLMCIDGMKGQFISHWSDIIGSHGHAIVCDNCRKKLNDTIEKEKPVFN